MATIIKTPTIPTTASTITATTPWATGFHKRPPSSVTHYGYDTANRLTVVDGISQTWDNNGNLLNDGVNTYTYDPANRLSSVTSLPPLGGNQSSVTSYRYNGLGDRLQTTVGSQTTTYLMDLNAGLSQVLDDGTNTYLYGNGRIAQSSIVNQQSQMEYFLGDALGSVRQMTSAAGNIVLANAYDPYGNLVASAGAAQTPYGFTGEYTDSTGSLYLWARYYTPETGRFMSRDTWGGDSNQPMSYNKWAYVYGNPVNLSDPTGMKPEDRGYCESIAGSTDQVKCEQIVRGIDPVKYSDWTMNNIEIWDALGLTTENCPPLYMTLPMPGGDDMAQDYGYWFHYMLEKTPGWWNMGGRIHTSFFVVAGFGITREAGTDSNRAGLLPILAEIFTRKGWTEGFYHMLGGRSTIRATVDSALINSAGGFNFQDRNELGSTNTFQQVLDIFANGPQGVNNPDVYKTDDNLFVEMYDALTNPDFHNDGGGNAPYEWGNPTTWTSSHYPNLMGALKHDIGVQKETGIDQIYYRVGKLAEDAIPTNGVYLGAFFALTLNQIGNWCGGHSCVAP